MPRSAVSQYPSWEEIAHASLMTHIASIGSAAELQRSLGSVASRYRFIERLRWPGGFRCADCGQRASNDYAVERTEPGRLTCRSCSATTRVLAGTLLDDRRAPLNCWLTLLWTFAGDPASVDVETVREILGLDSSKLAQQRWHVLDALQTLSDREPLRGTVEVDGRVLDLGMAHAIVLAGVEDRDGGRLRLWHTGHLGADVVHSFVQAVVEPGSVVRTDCWSGYLALNLYRHELRNDIPETSERLECVDLVMTKLRRWLRSRAEVNFEQLSHRLRAYCHEHNSGAGSSSGQRFCDLLSLALRESPKLHGKQLRARRSGVRRIDADDIDNSEQHTLGEAESVSA
jgi:hypothetical protein